MILHYLKIAWRNLLKNKFRYLFTAVSLALGVLIITATLYSLYQEDRLYSQYDNHKQLAAITLHSSSKSFEILLNTKQMKDALSNLSLPGIRETSLIAIIGETIDFETYDNTFFKYTCECAYVNKSFFHIFTSKIKSGSLSNWEKDGAIITDRFSKKIYKDENPIGKSVLLYNKYYKIVGVMEAYTFPGIVAADIYLPLPDEQMGRCYALLEKNTDIDAINSYLFEIKIEEPHFGEGFLKLSKLSGNNNSTQLFRKMLILSIIIFSSMVLLVAFINLLNLSVNSFRNMSRTIILRKTVGAQNRSIWLMAILMDIFVLLFAILFTFAISEISIKSLNHGVVSLGIKNLWIDSKIVYSCNYSGTPCHRQRVLTIRQ